MGGATVVAAADGSAKHAIYIRKGGLLINGNHALIPIAVGDVVIRAYHSRGDFVINVSAITSITDNEAALECIALYSSGEWNNPSIGEKYNAAISACVDKAMCYNCAEPHYIQRID